MSVQDCREPVGIADIAARLGVRANTVAVWRSRGTRGVQMPGPRWTVSGLPVWEWAEVREWARATGRWPTSRVSSKPFPREAEVVARLTKGENRA